MKQKPVTRSAEKEPLNVQIGSTARKARTALKLSQEDAAERVGVATEVYGRWERGEERPSTPTLIKLSKALGTSVDTLIGLAADKNATTTEPMPAPPMPRGVRRLRRTLRTMDKLQLSTFSRMAAALVVHQRKRRGSHRKVQAAAT
ncbi:helix-turn-helix transcriptional regulator [Archangium sp.]|uniref:helix-turn-helix domain-containing protein n=1 Tax=Archangium sp. TaxID=1872627 RepID=UPI00286C9458|nr:helix-turn-helix transcriptional regulator [Archangium sp.]